MAAAAPVAMSEPESKALLRCYDIPMPQEGVASTAEEAVLQFPGRFVVARARAISRLSAPKTTKL